MLYVLCGDEINKWTLYVTWWRRGMSGISEIYISRCIQSLYSFRSCFVINKFTQLCNKNRVFNFFEHWHATHSTRPLTFVDKYGGGEIIKIMWVNEMLFLPYMSTMYIVKATKVDATIPFTSQVYTLSAWAGLRDELILPITISTNHNVNAVYAVPCCKHKQSLDS